MALGLLKVIAAINGIEPRVQKVLCPLAIANNKTTRRQPVLVLRDYQVNAISLDVAEGFDDAIRGHDGGVCDHQFFKACGCENVRFEREGGRHDQGGAVEVPEER